jgi:hypothetical protein
VKVNNVNLTPPSTRLFYPKFRQEGNVLLMVLAGMAAIATLAIMGSTLYSTVISGNQRSSLISSTSQILTQAAYSLTTETNRAGSFPVATAPAGWSGTRPSTAPAIGTAAAVGLITATSTAPKVDAWGNNIAYCTFTAVAMASPVFAVISAGPNGAFNTTCTQALAGTAGDDDGVRFKTAANITQGVGGTVYYGDPVANVAALATLTSPKAGEQRYAIAEKLLYINPTGTAGAANWVLSQSLPIVVSGANCDTYPAGTIAVDAAGELYACK